MSLLLERPPTRRSLLPEAQRIESRRGLILPTPYNEAGIEKYGEPFIVAERIKVELRRAYRRAQYAAQLRGEDRDVQNRRAFDFWAEYESVNRRYIPNDPTYSCSEAGTALVVGANNCLVTILSPTTAWARVVESYIGGEAGASAVVRLSVSRSNTAATGGSVVVASKFSPFSPAAQVTTVINGTGGVVLTGVALIFHDFNAFGGTDRWVADPNHEIYFGGAVANGNQMTWQSLSGTSTVSAHQIWEEL